MFKLITANLNIIHKINNTSIKYNFHINYGCTLLYCSRSVNLFNMGLCVRLALEEKCGSRAVLINCRYVKCGDCNKCYDLGRAWNVSAFWSIGGHWTSAPACGLKKDERESEAAARAPDDNNLKELKNSLVELEQRKMRQFGTGAQREADAVGFVALQNEIEVKNTEVDAAKKNIRERKPAATGQIFRAFKKAKELLDSA